MKPGKTTEITLLEEEIKEIEKKIKSNDKKADRSRSRESNLTDARYSLPNIAKCDPSLDLRNVRSLLNKKIREQEAKTNALDEITENLWKMEKWVNHIRLAKEGKHFEGEEKRPFEEVKEFKSLYVKPGKYEKEVWSLEKISHQKYPGIQFIESGFRYRKRWIFIISEPLVEMYYRVEDVEGPDDEPHIYHPYAKESSDKTPPMIEVLKKMDEVIQK